MEDRRIEDILTRAINIEPANLMREGLSQEAVDDYAESIQSGHTFPRIVVGCVKTGSKKKYYLIDGYHRLTAMLQNNSEFASCDVSDYDTYDDVVKMALSSNRENGLRRTQGDLKKVILYALRLFPQMAVIELANRIGCSPRRIYQLKPDKVSATDKAKEVLDKPGAEEKSNCAVAREAGVDEGTVRRVRNFATLQNSEVDKQTPEEDNLDKVAQHAANWIADNSGVPEADDDDYDSQVRPNTTCVTEQSKRITPEVEKPSDPVVVKNELTGEEISKIRKENCVALSGDEDVRRISLKLIVLFEKRKEALIVLNDILKNCIEGSY